MPRPHRLGYEGAWHHVFNRGGNRRNIFVDARDRSTFLRLLVKATHREAVEVHAYCLMGNHYHLALHTPKGGLSEAMQQFSSEYTRSFNRRHERDGPLFRARFCSTVVETDHYIAALSRYVHRNPVDIGWHDLASYPWSSYGAYLGHWAPPTWLRTQALLRAAGGRPQFQELVEGSHQSVLDELLGNSHLPVLVGGGRPRSVSRPRPPHPKGV